MNEIVIKSFANITVEPGTPDGECAAIALILRAKIKDEVLSFTIDDKDLYYLGDGRGGIDYYIRLPSDRAKYPSWPRPESA